MVDHIQGVEGYGGAAGAEYGKYCRGATSAVCGEDRPVSESCSKWLRDAPLSQSYSRVGRGAAAPPAR